MTQWIIPSPAAARYRTSEHSANWHKAVLKIPVILKGPKIKKEQDDWSASESRNVAWVNAPSREGAAGNLHFEEDRLPAMPRLRWEAYTVDA